MGKEKPSYTIDSEVLRDFKRACDDRKLNYSQTVEELMKQFVVAGSLEKMEKNYSKQIQNFVKYMQG